MLKRIFIVLAALITSAAFAASPDQIVNDVMHSYLQKNEVPGAAVIVYVDGKPSAFYFGVADQESKKPVSKDTIFELGSITKVMTSLLLAQEVDFAKIKLKEPVNKYIPTLPATFGSISMRSLATHTSGLPFDVPPDVKNRQEWEKYAASWKPAQPADKDYTYSQIGIGLIGQALEAVTHQNYNQLYRTKILAPLGMQPIALIVPQKLQEFYAQGYNADGGIAHRVDCGVFPAAGEMKASAEDMGKFLSAAIGLPQTPESILYPMLMTQTAYVEVGDLAQGLGWQIHDLSPENTKDLLAVKDQIGLHTVPVSQVFAEPKFNGSTLIDKSGSTNGFRTYIAVIPSKKTGIVILTNRNVKDSDGILKAGREILFKLNGIS